jgi:hypothetical protein
MKNMFLLISLCLTPSTLDGGCARSHAPGGTDSSTHWLKACRTNDGCGGLVCLCGSCNIPCRDYSACRVAGLAAVCRPGSRLQCAAAPTLCVAECAHDGDCASIAGTRCVAGACAHAASPIDGNAAIDASHPSDDASGARDAGQSDGGMDGGIASCKVSTRQTCQVDGGCDWAAQRAQYRGCSGGPGGSSPPYLARCGAYNAVLTSGKDTSGADFYASNTGQLIASTFSTPGSRRCYAYDPTFTPPDACVALDGPCSCIPSYPGGNPVTWSEAFAASPCLASRCGTYNAIVRPPEAGGSLFYDQSTGALVGRTHENPNGRPADCYSYTPGIAPLFVPPTTPCVPFPGAACSSDGGTAGKGGSSGGSDAGSGIGCPGGVTCAGTQVCIAYRQVGGALISPDAGACPTGSHIESIGSSDYCFRDYAYQCATLAGCDKSNVSCACANPGTCPAPYSACGDTQPGMPWIDPAAQLICEQQVP